MKAILFLASVILSVALFGCASSETAGKVWYKENGTVEERDRLLAAARVQSLQAHTTPTLGTPDTSASRRQSEVEATMTFMTSHGWRLVPRSEAKPLRSAPTNNDTPSFNAMSSPGLDR